MREFFHGWRRKAGATSLMMALPLMALWIRSYIVFDQILAGGNLVISNSGCMVWNWTGWGGPDANILNWYRDNASPFDEDWYLGADGVRFPYWAVTIPITLFAAYLLLVPSRKRLPTASQSHA